MNPTEVAFSPDGSTAYVTNFGSGTVSVLAQVVVGSAVPAAGTVGSAYSFQVPAVHATGFTVAGVLPAGLSLDPSTDVISGTPTTAGTSTFTVTAIGYSQASKAYTITIAAATVTGSSTTGLAATGSTVSPILPAGALTLLILGIVFTLLHRRSVLRSESRVN